VSVKPYYGRVILTDYKSKYPDATDHCGVYARLTINDGEPDQTGAQVLTLNTRRYAFDGPPYDWDTHRGTRCVRLIAESGASVLALQECEPEQDKTLIERLPVVTGAPWGTVSSRTNVSIMFKSDRWRLLGTRNFLMDNGMDLDRRLVLALLQSVKTGAAVWFGSTHFGVGADLASWRRYQARQVIMHLQNVVRAPSEEDVPAEYFGDVRKQSVIMGDFNDWASTREPGVRREFAIMGGYELRDRLSDSSMAGDSYSTKHAFGKLTPHDGRQIDAIFTWK
jgi:endonuclease/exonuclease/phosphatase family metal-dependent hydrolase